MNEPRHRILELLAAGRLDVEAAESLLAALGVGEASDPAGGGAVAAEHPPDKPLTHLRVSVEREGVAEFNARVPVDLLRSGLSLADFVPPYAREAIDAGLRAQGSAFSLGRLTRANADELIARLREVDFEWEGARIRIRVA